ncbi:MAG: hypothetical protein WAL25_14715 [Acidimicrobiia bacterium]
MAYASENVVWLLESGESRLLSPEGLLGANPSLSSDGAWVAFTAGENESAFRLYVAKTDGSDHRIVGDHDFVQSSVDWSPDDSFLVFDQYSEEIPLQVFTVSATGSGEPAQLTYGEANGKPKWGPDDRILFLSLWDHGKQEIYSMAVDGSYPTNLTHDPARDVLAEMSPDGAEIVFASDRAGDDELDIWVMDADGTNPRRLTDQVERDTNPTWSSDGRHIIFRSDRVPEGLWYMNPDGSDQTLLLEGGWLASCP